jgi:hypothetical protein
MNSDELRAAKGKCYEVSLECAKSLKNNFAKFGAYSSEQRFIRGDPNGVSSGLVGKSKLLKKFLVIEEIYAPLLVPGGHVHLGEGWLQSY